MFIPCPNRHKLYTVIYCSNVEKNSKPSHFIYTIPPYTHTHINITTYFYDIDWNTRPDPYKSIISYNIWMFWTFKHSFISFIKWKKEREWETPFSTMKMISFFFHFHLFGISIGSYGIQAVFSILLFMNE